MPPSRFGVITKEPSTGEAAFIVNLSLARGGKCTIMVAERTVLTEGKNTVGKD